MLELLNLKSKETKENKNKASSSKQHDTISKLNIIKIKIDRKNEIIKNKEIKITDSNAFKDLNNKDKKNLNEDLYANSNCRNKTSDLANEYERNINKNDKFNTVKVRNNLDNTNFKLEEKTYFFLIETICKINYFKGNNNILIYLNFTWKENNIIFKVFLSVNYKKFKSLINLDCNDLLCSDFCFNSGTELTENCNARCKKSIFDGKNKEKYDNSIEFILKRFFLYKNKNEILYDNNQKDFSLELNNLIKTNEEKSNKSNPIEIAKNKIEDLKKQLLNEETNLLNLYKLKRWLTNIIEKLIKN